MSSTKRAGNSEIQCLGFRNPLSEFRDHHWDSWSYDTPIDRSRCKNPRNLVGDLSSGAIPSGSKCITCQFGRVLNKRPAIYKPKFLPFALCVWLLNDARPWTELESRWSSTLQELTRRTHADLAAIASPLTGPKPWEPDRGGIRRRAPASKRCSVEAILERNGPAATHQDAGRPAPARDAQLTDRPRCPRRQTRQRLWADRLTPARPKGSRRSVVSNDDVAPSH